MKQLLYVQKANNQVSGWLTVADDYDLGSHPEVENTMLYLIDDVPMPEVSEEETAYVYYDGANFTYEIKPRIKTIAEKYEELMRDIDGHLANAATVASLREQLKITQDALDTLLLK
ncbi:hypothetical protein [Brevibacillus brevis]|uniref:hypothetical protein n=1 Tax=Brevibacillus brevis TaxID=1393 RepID=UPI00115B1E50|nr:hypothetical protein [Lysinibacillus sp. SDF0063]TQR29379.1 hypothetical protein C7Y45_28695 [Lysinibacillus sp. SDF0063]